MPYLVSPASAVGTSLSRSRILAILMPLRPIQGPPVFHVEAVPYLVSPASAVGTFHAFHPLVQVTKIWQS